MIDLFNARIFEDKNEMISHCFDNYQPNIVLNIKIQQKKLEMLIKT